MQDSLLPPGKTGGSKMVYIFLIGGVVFLLAAGALIFRKSKNELLPATPQHVDNAPAVAPQVPLVIGRPAEPIVAEMPVEDTPNPEKSNKKRSRTKAEKVGKIDASQVNKFINSNFSQVKTCYERRLRINPLLQGKLDLNINISSAGHVTHVAVNQDTVGDGPMIQCVKRTISRWSFPKPEGGRVVIGKTFNFKKKA